MADAIKKTKTHAFCRHKPIYGNCLQSDHTGYVAMENVKILSTNVDKKSFETEFLIAICRQSGDKWRWKILFLVIFDLCLLRVFYPVYLCIMKYRAGKIYCS